MNLSKLFITSIVFVVLLLGKTVFAQGEDNWWYFGQNSGLDFNGGAPVAVTNGQVATSEGSASISDAAGNLLFYSDGIKVWDANHVQMPNGSGLMGTASSTQAALIVKKPGSSTIYYLFTAAGLTQPGGIRYSEIDMTLNGGLGDITANKNILLNTPSCEKLAGIMHCNEQDVWVITHDWASDVFRIYLVTSAGVNPLPVLSNAGLVVSTSDPANAIGYLKASPDGRKLASASTAFPTERFELFDFNNTTGVVSNAISFPPLGSQAYGVEFSDDGTKLYYTNSGLFSSVFATNLYQINLCAGSNAAIINSRSLIASASSIPYLFGLQRGPDNKIYATRNSAVSLSVIANPNVLGAGCNFITNGVNLSGKQCYMGLPNFVVRNNRPMPVFTSSFNCLAGNFTTPTVNLSNCSGTSTAIISQMWDFGDPVSGANNTSSVNNPSHIFTSAGTYTVTLILNYACKNDTIRQTVTAVNCGPLNAGMQGLCTKMCLGSCQTMNVLVTGGTPPYTYSWVPNIGSGRGTYTLCPTISTMYTVKVFDSAGDSASASCLMSIWPVMTASVTTTPASCGNSDGTAMVIVSGGTAPFTYNWSPYGGSATTASGLSPGTYSISITDANGCTETQTVTVTQASGPFASASTSASTISAGGSATLTASGGGTYLWSPSTGLSCTTCVSPVASPTQSTVYCVFVTDSSGCQDSVCITIDIFPPVDLPCETIYIPNAFSPNNDLDNDLECVFGSCIEIFHLVIYNRWGEKVFESNDQKTCWDGMDKGNPLNTGVFDYYLQVTLTSGEKVKKKGNISLIR